MKYFYSAVDFKSKKNQTHRDAPKMWCTPSSSNPSVKPRTWLCHITVCVYAKSVVGLPIRWNRLTCHSYKLCAYRLWWGHPPFQLGDIKRQYFVLEMNRHFHGWQAFSRLPLAGVCDENFIGFLKNDFMQNADVFHLKLFWHATLRFYFITRRVLTLLKENTTHHVDPVLGL